jgi:hypothetical protein
MFDVGKVYRDKVNAFNATSFYGSEQAKIQVKEQERSNPLSTGGLNDTAKEVSYWELDNPHSSVTGDQAYLQLNSGWTTKYKETEVNKLQYIQAPQYGYHKNYWVKHLLEIEANRVANVVPSMVGNGNLTLEVDKSS